MSKARIIFILTLLKSDNLPSYSGYFLSNLIILSLRIQFDQLWLIPLIHMKRLFLLANGSLMIASVFSLYLSCLLSLWVHRITSMSFYYTSISFVVRIIRSITKVLKFWIPSSCLRIAICRYLWYWIYICILVLFYFWWNIISIHVPCISIDVMELN